jgi:NitT/TauT family transport system substrate-binding protein
MTSTLNRRAFLNSAVGVAAGASMLGAPSILRAQSDLPRVTYVTLASGFNVILNEYMAAKRFDLKNGVNIDVINSYVSVSNYYNDLTAGTFELGIGAWDTFALRRAAGVPLKLVCTINTYDILRFVGMKSGPKSVKDLKGQTVGAIRASGAYRVAGLALREFHGLEFEKDIKVQNVESPVAAVTQVLAGNVAAGLTWEPNISVGESKDGNLGDFHNVGEDYKKNLGIDLPYFGFALREEAEKRHPGVAAKVSAAMRDCIEGVSANLDEAVALAAPKMRVEPAVLKTAFTSKRLSFKPVAMQDKAGRENVLKAAEYLVKNGLLKQPIEDSFFA